MKFNRENKSVLFTAVLTLLFVTVYIVFRLLPPSGLIFKFSGITFNDNARVDSVFYKYSLSLVLLGFVILVLLWFSKSIYPAKTAVLLKKIFTAISEVFTINTVLAISVLYLTVLLSAAVYYYDLGFDEAWYITFARNFSEKLFPYYTANERIAVIDTISMLPYYIFSLINFKLGFLEVWQFKLMCTLMSVITLFVLFKITSSLYSRTASVLFIFFIIIQPGFGFVASSYFGEFVQSAFLFYGLYFWLKRSEEITNRKLIITSLFFATAIHTKFQLVIILAAVLLIMGFTDKASKPLKLLFYTLLFTAVVSLVRTIPVLIVSPASIKSLAIITDLLAAKSTSVSASLIFERLQLFNRFFPLAGLIVISASFSFVMKNPFERFILFFTLITSFWWIFIYPLSTYRNPFMAVITLCFMAAIMLDRLYAELNKNYPAKKIYFKSISALCVVILMLYGFSANIIYARVGYNDGVQFDLDGFKNRLFSVIKHDNTQKDFHKELSGRISSSDTLYNGSFVTRFYVPNEIFTLEKMTESLKISPPGSEKLLLVTRDVYPLGFEKIHRQMDSLALSENLQKRLIFKMGSYELYGIKK